MVNQNGNYYRVEKLTWLVDENKDIMITKNVINGGFAYERELTAEEEFIATIADQIPRKLSKRNIILGTIAETETTLSSAFIEKVLVNEIIDEDMKKKIAARDEEVAKQKAAQDAKEAAEKERIRKENAEKNRAKKARKNYMHYTFPSDALSAMIQMPFSEEEMDKVNETIVEELDNIKYYIEDKETLIEIIIHLYKAKDGCERLMPYPEERYDNCRAVLKQHSVDYLNVVLKQTIGNSKYYDSYVERVCKSKNIQYVKK